MVVDRLVGKAREEDITKYLLYGAGIAILAGVGYTLYRTLSMKPGTLDPRKVYLYGGSVRYDIENEKVEAVYNIINDNDVDVDIWLGLTFFPVKEYSKERIVIDTRAWIDYPPSEWTTIKAKSKKVIKRVLEPTNIVIRHDNRVDINEATGICLNAEWLAGVIDINNHDKGIGVGEEAWKYKHYVIVSITPNFIKDYYYRFGWK